MRFIQLFATFFLAHFFLVHTNVFAAELHVGTGQTYSTIASAISASGSGDTIVIHAGTYNENNLRPKTNTILQKATGESNPIIDGGQDNGRVCPSQIPVFKLDSKNNITFDGLTVHGGELTSGEIGLLGIMGHVTILSFKTVRHI